MPVQHPEIDEVPHDHAVAGCQRLVDRQIGEMKPEPEQFIGNRAVELPAQPVRPLQDRPADCRSGHDTFPEAVPDPPGRHRVAGVFERCDVPLGNVCQVPAGENVLIVAQPEAMLLNYRAAGKRTSGVPVGAENGGDGLLEVIERHCRAAVRLRGG